MQVFLLGITLFFVCMNLSGASVGFSHGWNKVVRSCLGRTEQNRIDHLEADNVEDQRTR